MRPVFASLLILLASSPALAAGAPAAKAAAATPAPNAGAKAPQTNPNGYPVPDFKGYELLPYPKSGLTDTSSDIPGKETMVETWQNKAGDQLMKMTLHGVTFAFGVLPAGEATKGYILFDPNCAKKLTLKYAPDAPFEAPKCAVLAKGK